VIPTSILDDINNEKLQNKLRLGRYENPSNVVSSSMANKSNSSTDASIGEQLCRKSLERIYKKPFKKCTPEFLRNPETNRPLELDGYNEELRIAFEYNGIQHYKWPNFTKNTVQDFIQQVRRDRYKTEMCDKNGVYLIIIPYKVPHHLIDKYIHFYYRKRQRTSKSRTNNYDSAHRFPGSRLEKIVFEQLEQPKKKF